MQVEAGVTTGDVRRLAREHGLMFPPDPGGAEQSQIGGNIATNAGGPHAFKYGVTGKWVTGLEAAVPPGELITVGGATRKDVAGYDLRSLLIGSEGTLGIVTAAWLRLVPAPEAAWPVAAFYDGIAAGCRAIERVFGNGLEVAALEYLDGGTLDAAGASFPVGMPAGAGFLVIAEADGSAEEAARLRDEIVSVLGEGALAVAAPSTTEEVADLWRWRDGVTFAVTAQLRREAERGHRRAARPDRGGDRGDARDRPPARASRLQLGPRRRRESALHVPAGARRSRAARSRRARRPTTCWRWRFGSADGLGRARPRARPQRLAGAPVGPARGGAAQRRSSVCSTRRGS